MPLHFLHDIFCLLASSKSLASVASRSCCQTAVFSWLNLLNVGYIGGQLFMTWAQTSSRGPFKASGMLSSMHHRRAEFPSWNFRLPTSKLPKVNKELVWLWQNDVSLASVHTFVSSAVQSLCIINPIEEEKVIRGNRHHYTVCFAAL